MKFGTKKILSAFLALALLISMVGCKGIGDSSLTSDGTPDTNSHIEESSNLDSSSNDNSKDDSSKDDNSKDDSSKDDSSKDDSSKDDSSKEDTKPVVKPSVTEKGVVSYYGQMQTKGNKIVGSKTNNVVTVAGMSFFWSNWSQKYYTKDNVEKMKNDFNCEIVRAAYGVQDSGVPHDKTDEARIRTLVEAAIENDLYVIIDWHSHGAHNNPAEAKAFFSKMAKDYGKYDNVIFEIYNEPLQIPWATVKSYALEIIPAIREHSDNLIVVGTPTWSQDVDMASADPINDKNVAYTLHFYAGTHTDWIRQKAETALNKGIPLFVTEWGSVNADGNGGISYESTQQWINWMNQKGISWCNWAVNDKNETSSIYNSDGSYTEAGRFLKDIITRKSKNAEWKTGKPKAPENYVFNSGEYK